MSTVALSTMWAQQERFRGHMDLFAKVALQSGYDAIEPSHSIDGDDLDALIANAVLPLNSLHAPAPRQRDGGGRWNTDLNLAAIDPAERQAAVDASLRTIQYARDAGAAAVVLHLGACGSGPLAEEIRLRSLFAAGEQDSAEADRLRDAARAARAGLAERHLPYARRSLEQLADAAERAGVSLGLENRLHYHEIPSWDEAPELLAPYPARLVGYWHDVGHAEVLDRLGLVDRSLWLSTNGRRAIGAHLHDVNGIVDHRPPGEGDVQWSYIAAGLPAAAMHTVEINQHSAEATLAAGRRFLTEQGIIPGPESELS